MRSVGSSRAEAGAALAIVTLVSLCIGLSNQPPLASAAAAESCHLREFDLCMTSAVVFVQQPSGVKVSEAEVEKQCVLFKETEECLDAYADRCMTPMQDALVDMLSGGLIQYMRDYCRKGSELRRKYLKHGDCVQGKRKETNKCLLDFQAGIEKSTSDETHWKDRPKAFCCAMDRLADCSEKVIEPACGREAVDVANLFIKGSFSRAATVTCAKYKHTSPQCKSLLPPLGSKPRGAKSNSVLSKLLSTITQA